MKPLKLSLGSYLWLPCPPATRPFLSPDRLVQSCPIVLLRLCFPQFIILSEQTNRQMKSYHPLSTTLCRERPTLHLHNPTYGPSFRESSTPRKNGCSLSSWPPRSQSSPPTPAAEVSLHHGGEAWGWGGLKNKGRRSFQVLRFLLRMRMNFVFLSHNTSTRLP